MSATKKTIVGEHSINTGVHTQFEIDLNTTGFSGGNIAADCLGYSKVAVSVTSIGATGTSGSAAIKQSNYENVSDATQIETAQLTVTANDTDQVFDLQVSGRYVLVDVTEVTFGLVGKVQIDIIAKR